MPLLTRKLLLNTFIRHETLTIDSLSNLENSDGLLKEDHLQFLLLQLIEEGYLDTLNDVTPCTYTITSKGFKEGARLNKEVVNALQPLFLDIKYL